jgi:hypothetical protein
MVKLKLVRVAAATAASAGLIAGFSGIVSAHPHKYYDQNQGSKTFTNTQTNNSNEVGVSNDTEQTAYTGNATVNASSHKSGGNDWWNNKHDDNSGNSGNATSGNASNGSKSDVSVKVSNPNPMPVEVPSNSSSHGSNLTVTNTETNNENNVEVSNTTDQYASSGNATVNGGSKNSGSAKSGNASNSSNSTVTVVVSN